MGTILVVDDEPRYLRSPPYWLSIGPFSAWIRRMFLRGARGRAVTGMAGGRVSTLDT